MSDSPHPSSARGKSRPHVVRVVLTMLVATILVAAGVLSFNAIRSARTKARRMGRSQKLRSVMLSIHNLHDVTWRLPTSVYHDESGATQGSWRFQLMPFNEATSGDFTARWDDPANLWLTDEPYDYYCRCESPCTNVVLITGPGTAFDGEKVCTLDDLDVDTILAIEIADTDIPWAAPGDLDIDEVTPFILNGFDGDGLLVAFADGEVWYLRKDVGLKNLKQFCTIEGAEQADREQILGPYRPR